MHIIALSQRVYHFLSLFLPLLQVWSGGTDRVQQAASLPRRRRRCKRGPAQSVGRARVEVKVFEKSSLSAMRISSARYFTNVNFLFMS